MDETGAEQKQTMVKLELARNLPSKQTKPETVKQPNLGLQVALGSAAAHLPKDLGEMRARSMVSRICSFRDVFVTPAQAEIPPTSELGRL